MSVQSDIKEIRVALRVVETSLRDLHNLLSQKLSDNADLLGLTSNEVHTLGGGTDKP